MVIEYKHKLILASIYHGEGFGQFTPTKAQPWCYIVFPDDNLPGVKDLVQAGLVKRERNQAHKQGYLDKKIGSKYAYALTPKGREVARTIRVKGDD